MVALQQVLLLSAPCTILTRSSWMPSASDTIIANVVSWLWPCDLAWVCTVTRPPASSTISTSSFAAWPAPVFSITVEIPMPRSFPFFPDCARRLP